MEEAFNPNAQVPATMPTCKELRRTAKAGLTGRWLNPVLCTLVYVVITGAISCIPWIGWVASLMVAMPLGFGYSIAFLRHMRGEDVDTLIVRPFDAFKDYGRYLGTSLLTAVFTFLWCLLLIVPGIIKAYSYAMTPYVMYDHPELGADECIEKSMEMMKGYKWKLFCLDLSFIGWIILCILTLGILTLWVSPWQTCAHVRFYEELKAKRS